jgi:hypothetical protein
VAELGVERLRIRRWSARSSTQPGGLGGQVGGALHELTTDALTAIRPCDVQLLEEQGLGQPNRWPEKGVSGQADDAVIVAGQEAPGYYRWDAQISRVRLLWRGVELVPPRTL